MNCSYGIYATLVERGGEGILLMGHGKTSVACVLGEIVADDVAILYLRRVAHGRQELYGQRCAGVRVLRSRVPPGFTARISKRESVRVSRLLYLCPEKQTLIQSPVEIEPWELYHLCNQFFNADFAVETVARALCFTALLREAGIKIYAIPWKESFEERMRAVERVLEAGAERKGVLKRVHLHGALEHEPLRWLRWRAEVVVPHSERENVTVHVAAPYLAKRATFRLKACRQLGVVRYSAPPYDELSFPEASLREAVRRALYAALPYLPSCGEWCTFSFMPAPEKEGRWRLLRRLGALPAAIAALLRGRLSVAEI